MNSQLKQNIASLILVAVGFLCVSLSSFLPVEFGLLSFLVGIFVASYAVLDLHLTQNHLSFAEALRAFQRDQRGIAWVWAEAALAIVFTPFVYWAVGWPYSIIVTQVTSMHTFTGTMALALAAVQVFISYIMAFALIAIVIHALINAKSPQGGTL